MRACAQSCIVIDDDQLVAGSVCGILEHLDFVVHGSASSAADALWLAEHTLPDFAVVDVQLNGATNGVELARTLHHRFNTGIIFLSGTCDHGVLSRAGVHAARFVGKPFRPAALLSAIEAVLGEATVSQHRSFCD